MVLAEGVSSPPSVVLRGGALWISLCWTHANYCGRSGRSGSEEDHSLGCDTLVTWRDGGVRIHRRWAHVRTQRIALSTKRKGIGIVGGDRDVALRPQSRNSSEAGERSVISTRRLCLSQPKEINCELRLNESRLHEGGDQVTIEKVHTESSQSEPRYMDTRKRSEVVVVVIPGTRKKSKKTRGHEKCYWTHSDQQQDGDRGVNTHNRSVPREAMLFVLPGPGAVRKVFSVHWSDFPPNVDPQCFSVSVGPSTTAPKGLNLTHT